MRTFLARVSEAKIRKPRDIRNYRNFTSVHHVGAMKRENLKIRQTNPLQTIHPRAYIHTLQNNENVKIEKSEICLRRKEIFQSTKYSKMCYSFNRMITILFFNKFGVEVFFIFFLFNVVKKTAVL